ncbi:MAG: flagellar type III secretion system pore protein FliP [Woeseia sp.]|nr:flagellar type III secretion system pore protein FliP [Woeseia sp.]MBT8096501.1 flagellar type III secretion system pore protein FliP [Woeseia sp.]NNE61847.1 flagellar type III secretion system pore protein FliP [Woeseia sp.]NNL53740.1 flagellar type III secretion system pore protein FliP [Woeseia sp.]
MIRLCCVIALLLFPLLVTAQVAPVTVTAIEGQSFSLSIQILVMMTLLTLLPAAILSTSAFVRIIIVLSILRQALGTAQTPPNQVLLGVALFLTFFVMTPVIDAVYADAVAPYMAEEISAETAFTTAVSPLREFMLGQTRESDIALFTGIANYDDVQADDDIPLSILVSSFIVSELKTAFQIGFLVFIPFLVIDLVVSSVLMSMGMMMLSPMLISLPFKIMLFVLVDGWALVLGTLASSFYT